MASREPCAEARRWTLTTPRWREGVARVEGPDIAVGERVEVVLLADVLDWLRSDEGEETRARAIRDDIPPEDALAHALEARFGSAGGDG